MKKEKPKVECLYCDPLNRSCRCTVPVQTQEQLTERLAHTERVNKLRADVGMDAIDT